MRGIHMRMRDLIFSPTFSRLLKKEKIACNWFDV